MPDDNDSIRHALDPVMLEFGATVYICQLFENSLCLLMALVAEHLTSSDGKAFQASWDFHAKKTLGGLVCALKDQINVPLDFEALLQEGVQARNKIIHGYLPNNMKRVFDLKARKEIIEELKTLRAVIRSQDLAVVRIIDELLKKYGTSTDALKQQATELWRWLNFESMAKTMQ